MNDALANVPSPPQCSFEGQIFFYCLPSGYQPLSICLAEGLKQLGIPFYSNVDFWKISPEREDYLFRYHPNMTPDECTVVVVEKGWVIQHHSLPENLFHPGRNYITVYLDDMDGPISPAWYPASRNFDFIFRTHLNSQAEYPTNFLPWVFGLSNRVLRETCNLPDFQQRNKYMLANFRVTQDKITLMYFGDVQPPLPPGMARINSTQLKVEHPLRKLFGEQFCSRFQAILPVEDTVDYFDEPPSDPYHYLQWQQTDRRHYPNYYQRLKAAAACAAFGGYLVPPRDSQPPYLEWWDSWRFWESLAAGCVTFHVDLQKYGAVLPVMPENWRHYIGIDLDNIEDTVHRIASDPGLLERISVAGHQWAIENYSPVPTAVRFLETIRGNPLSGDSRLWRKDYSLTLSLPVHLSEINYIIFPNWSQPEESLIVDLERVFRWIASHPDKNQMTLLIDTSGISEEDANLIVSGAAMNLLMEEDLDVTQGLEISLVHRLGEIQWQALLPRIQARIILENENQQAMAQAKAETLQVYELDSLINKQSGQVLPPLSHELFQQAKWQEAIDYYEKIIEAQTGTPELYWCLSECFRQLNRPERASSILQEGIQIYGTVGNFYFSAIINLQLNGYIQESLSCANTACQLLPHDYTFKLLKNLLLPIIYQTSEEINLHRQRFIKGLQTLIQQTSLETPEEQKNALAGIARFTNFYLSYQNQNDRELLGQYGTLVHQIMAANYPNWIAPLSMPPLKDNQKIRIGYVSNYFHAYSGTLWLTGWLRYCDKENFEIYCYYIGDYIDPVTQQFQNSSDVFHHFPHNLEATCEQIIADQLHILVFPEIGMNPQTLQIAALRLAPIQCVAWGHPVTSGLPTMDYFLSSELMESEKAQDHYSETLIRLPNIGVSYPKPYIPTVTKTRADFQLRDDAVIYLCCQAPFKYLPHYDFVFAEIARRVPQSQFLFLRGHLLKPRLNRAFAEVGLKSEDYCVFRTIPERFDYLMINLLSDVYLDTFSWSGGNTTLEAIACNLPVVTCPGEFMRTRHSDSFLKRLGVTDTIAQNEAEYIEIAVKLGLDPTWRRHVADRMNERHNYLYDDKACIAGLEALYKQVVRERLA